MGIYTFFLMAFLLISFDSSLFAGDFNLDSPRNKGTWRFEVNNDAVFDKDSNFSNGWSLQYHTVRYASWEETEAPGFIKWVGKHFPTLHDDDSIVRYGQGIGQNMITPENLSLETPQGGDLPYAGTLTYTLNWQSFNQRTARNFQVTAGILGEETLAEDFQKFVHVDLDRGRTPRGWDTQRKTEPIVNIGYHHLWRLASLGEYDNGWAGNIALGPIAHLGNLLTAVELAFEMRFGWNILEGFNSYPAPPGRGFFQAYYLPKPSLAAAHSVEVVFGARASGLIYSVLYDGSIITGDDRSVEREDFVYAGLIGLNYHYYDWFSIRASLNYTSAILDEEVLPDPLPGYEKTSTENSYGTLAIDFYF